MLARTLGTKAIPLAQAGPDSDIIWICHTDDALAETARKLARKTGWQGKICFSFQRRTVRVMCFLRFGGLARMWHRCIP